MEAYYAHYYTDVALRRFTAEFAIDLGRQDILLGLFDNMPYSV